MCPCSYPHALYFLDLLQTPEFRAKIANPAYKEMVHTQQVGKPKQPGLHISVYYSRQVLGPRARLQHYSVQGDGAHAAGGAGAAGFQLTAGLQGSAGLHHGAVLPCYPRAPLCPPVWELPSSCPTAPSCSCL